MSLDQKANSRIIEKGRKRTFCDSLIKTLVGKGHEHYLNGKESDDKDNAQEEYKKAEEIFKEVIGARPNNYDAHKGLSSSLARQERFEEAIEECKKAIELKPKEDHSFIVLTDIITRLHDKENHELMTTDEKEEIAWNIKFTFNTLRYLGKLEGEIYDTVIGDIVRRFNLVKKDILVEELFNGYRVRTKKESTYFQFRKRGDGFFIEKGSSRVPSEMKKDYKEIIGMHAQYLGVKDSAGRITLLMDECSKAVKTYLKEKFGLDSSQVKVVRIQGKPQITVKELNNGYRVSAPGTPNRYFQFEWMHNKAVILEGSSALPSDLKNTHKRLRQICAYTTSRTLLKAECLKIAEKDIMDQYGLTKNLINVVPL